MNGYAQHSARPLFLAGFITCVLLMAAALYLQYVSGLEPCPLCILQRIAVIALGLVFLAATLHDPGRIGQRVYAALLVLAAAAGAAVAGRHVWLENLPEDRVPSCGPGLEYMLENFPLGRTLELVLRGSGECAEVSWRMLGLSIPSWTLIAFAGFAGFGLYLLLRRRPGRARAAL
jgi:disulfide bond formation protein DsbB